METPYVQKHLSLRKYVMLHPLPNKFWKFLLHLLFLYTKTYRDRVWNHRMSRQEKRRETAYSMCCMDYLKYTMCQVTDVRAFKMW